MTTSQAAPSRRSRRVVGASALGAVMLLLAALPASGQAAKITFGSNLRAAATVSFPHPVDTAFWSASVSGGGRTRAPKAGQIATVSIKGCARPAASGAMPPTTQVHFQALTPPAGGTAKVEVTTNPFNLPICGHGGSASTISTFHPINFCVHKGDVVDFNDEGGFGPAFPQGVSYEVFGRVHGASTDSYTAANQTNNGDSLKGTPHAGAELLMRMVLATGHSEGPACHSAVG